MFGGQFTTIDVTDFDVVCRGAPSSVDLRLGFGRTGDLEVELVEVVSGTWPTVEWLAQHGEGLHHLRYPVDDIAGTRADMEAHGCRVILEGGDGEVSFAYLEVPQLNGMVVELIQMPSA
jgi:catechol 2,3-dioxygenase-like lactoylglutathione lyase family enzyme